VWKIGEVDSEVYSRTEIQTKRNRPTDRQTDRPTERHAHYILSASVSQKFLYPKVFLKNFPGYPENFQLKFIHLLCVHTYAKIQNFIQLPLTLTKFCHMKRDHLVNISNLT